MMNKFDRVFSTLVVLQSGRTVRASSIADRFGISLRTVYRDISTLKNAGVPIIGDPGIGYSIMDGYRLPPISFSEGEAAALLTAEKLIGQMTDRETQAYYSNAMTKIKAILRSSEKEAVDILNDSIAISNRSEEDKQSYLQELLKSIPNKNLVFIHYKKVNGDQSERTVEPIGCYHHANSWYLMAYCQSKEDYRTFKLKRIVSLCVLSDQFDREHISLKDYIDQQDQAWREEHQFHRVEIAFTQRHIEHAERRKYYFGFVDQQVIDNRVHMTFSNPSIELMARWLLQFGDQATAIAPESLVQRIKTLAKQMYEHYH